MGDRITITKIEFLDQGDRKLYQIDLYNETKNEHYRAFCEIDIFEGMLQKAKEVRYADFKKSQN